jgi:hypothetical protein
MKKNKLVIGLAGPAQVGKSQIASIIQERFPRLFALQVKNYGFADPIKDMLAAGLGLDYEDNEGGRKEKTHPIYGCSPRQMQQLLGTEWGRNLIHPDLWVLIAKQRCLAVDADVVIFNNVRYENEAAFVREQGVLVHVYGRGGIKTNHSSENGVVREPEDLGVNNSQEGLEYLEYEVEQLMQELTNE